MSIYRTIRAMEDQDMRDLDRYEECLSDSPLTELQVHETVPGTFEYRCFDDELGSAHCAIAELAAGAGFTEWLGLVVTPGENQHANVIDNFARPSDDEVAA